MTTSSKLPETAHFFSSADELLAWAEWFADSLSGGEVLALTGDLGAGKTTFMKGLVKGLKSKTVVTSPTFNLVHRYSDGRKKVIHYDLYRLKKTSDLESVDLELELEDQTQILAIEWPQLAESFLPIDRTIRIQFKEESGGRKVIVQKSSAKTTS